VIGRLRRNRLGLGPRGRRAAATLGATGLALALWLRLGPLPDGFLDDRQSASTVVVDRHGAPLYETLSADGTRSVRLTAETLPPVLAQATTAAEDRRFYSHVGVDPIAIARALRINVLERRLAEGGSTISQQVAKLLLNRLQPGRRRGPRAKIREAVLALRLEHRLTKRQLLALYLDHAAYGGQIVGAERASRAYFGVPASMLTPAQAAFLAGLPQRPSGFNPYRHPGEALERQRAVLRRMEQAGALTAEEARIARAERLVFRRPAAPFGAPHFVEMVLAAAPDPRPPRIDTTIDLGLQAEVAGIIESHRQALTRHGAGNVAVVVLDNQTAEWLAWEGSGDYWDQAHGGAIDGARTPRQPGSALKPFAYALAFEQGRTPATVLPDIPSHFPTAEPGVAYSPRNYDGRYRGPLLARRALAGSENVPAVALASEVGVPVFLRLLQRAGLTTFEKNAAFYGLGVTLGNAEVRLDELVAAYSAFARGGTWVQPAFLRRRPGAATSGLRGGLASGRPPAQVLVSPRTAFWISDILSDAEAREYVFGRGGSLEFPFAVAVKTGTSQAYHDNWTIGYSRHVTVGVWVGNFDRTPLRNSSGVTGAAPIFHAVMLAAERRAGGAAGDSNDAPIAEPPSGLEAREICALSGQEANAWCPSRRLEWLPADEPRLPCSWHHLSDEGLLTIYPPPYETWARETGHLMPGLAAGVSRFAVNGGRGGSAAPRASARAAFGITNPPDGATYLIDPTLRRDFQALRLSVSSAAPGRVEWRVDGRAVGVSPHDGSIEWPLAPGRHRITARDRSGSEAEASIVVK
jgi:penicillin-binding protein 1C